MVGAPESVMIKIGQMNGKWLADGRRMGLLSIKSHSVSGWLDIFRTSQIWSILLSLYK
jgi:hypothetical protein